MNRLKVRIYQGAKGFQCENSPPAPSPLSQIKQASGHLERTFQTLVFIKGEKEDRYLSIYQSSVSQMPMLMTPWFREVPNSTWFSVFLICETRSPVTVLPLRGMRRRGWRLCCRVVVVLIFWVCVSQEGMLYCIKRCMQLRHRTVLYVGVKGEISSSRGSN